MSEETNKPWRLSGMTTLVILLVGFALMALAPGFKTLVEQRQQIADQERLLEIQKQELENLTAELDRWRDPAYIRSVARERLFYAMPGEVSYLLIGGEEFVAGTGGNTTITDQITVTESNWASTLFLSSLLAGAGDFEAGE